MLTALRTQVQGVLYAVSARRKPALRRSDAPDALFATDLPLIAEADAVRAFMADMEEQGWIVRARNGWLTLDAPVPVPDTAIPAESAGEWGCCISLLLRHPGDASAEDYVRAIAKGAESGRVPFERLCNQLHADFAARLRNHEPLPGVLLPYLCHAGQTLYK